MPAPRWTSDEKSGITLTLFTSQVTPHVPPHVTPHVEKLLGLLDGEMSREQLMATMGVADAKHFRSTYLRPALDEGLVEMTQPDKPRSVLQRYRLTQQGLTVKSK